MTIKVGINGFGRIGRLVFRAAVQQHADDIEIVGINDLIDVDYIAYMLKYDTVHGRFDGDVSVDGGNLVVNGKTIRVTAEKDPANLKWNEVGAEYVVEATGLFLTKEKAQGHITAGAKRVVMSAPAKDDTPMFVMGVNHKDYTGDMQFMSNASCTTNCLAPMVKVLDDAFGVEKGFMTTVHAYTADQRIQDAPHRDLRRARAAAVNIVPTTTGAAKAVGLVLPHLKGKLDGGAMRVPVPTGSLTDFTAVLKKEATAEEVDAAFKQAAAGAMKGILQYTTEPLVSSDIVGNKHSCIYDSEQTKADGTLVKVVGWYDNEAGYSARLADLTVRLAKM